MRLWSIHPKHLDAKGLVALWREALLAQKVLRNLTKGYKNHPQLDRFKASPDPVGAIGAFLQAVFAEAARRGYDFAGEKIYRPEAPKRIAVTEGQVEYEWKHFLGKVKARSPETYRDARKLRLPEVHPLFRVKAGGKEPWEK